MFVLFSYVVCETVEKLCIYRVSVQGNTQVRYAAVSRGFRILGLGDFRGHTLVRPNGDHPFNITTPVFQYRTAERECGLTLKLYV